LTPWAPSVGHLCSLGSYRLAPGSHPLHRLAMSAEKLQPCKGHESGWNRPRLAVLLILALTMTAAGCGDRGSAGDAPDAAGGTGEARAPAVVAPSFDCQAASGEIEELICATPELAALDLRLDSVWQQVEARLADGSWPESEQAVMRAEQRGWIGGRNECWKADDPRACAIDEYARRTVTLMARFGFVEGRGPTFWSCEGEPANEFVLTFFPTDPQSVRVERGDQQDVMIQTRTASGARYLGTFGKEVWVQGEEGTFVWPQGDTLTCELRPTG